MSVISTICEHGNTLNKIQNHAVKEHAGQIAGKFKVFRTEIGASKMPLR